MRKRRKRWCGAVLGSPIGSTPAVRAATGVTRWAGPTTPGFVAPGHYSPLFFYPLPAKAVEDLDHKDIQFFEMNSAIKGYVGKMVDAVLKDLPKE
jgi:hypothetical protein